MCQLELKFYKRAVTMNRQKLIRLKKYRENKQVGGSNRRKTEKR